MKTLLTVLFILCTAQAYGQESFLKACRNEPVQEKSIKNDLKWLKAFYKTNDCAILAQKISKIKSLSEIILPKNSIDDRIKNSWTEQFPYQYGVFFSGKASSLFSSLNLDLENTFTHLGLYRDFKNIKHITITDQYSYSYKHSTCEILQLFPHLETVSIEWHKLIEKENDNCLSKSKIKGVILRGKFRDDEEKPPKTKILGIENYTANLKQLYRYPHLAYLGISSYSISQGKLEELSGRINITHFSMSAKGTKGISNLGNLVNLSYLSLTCMAEFDDGPLDCEGASFLEDISFLKRLRWLTELKLNHHEIKDITPIESLKSLKLLELRGNNIERIPVFENLLELKVLDLSGNKLKNLHNIQYLKNLQLLDVSSNQISDYAPISELVKLTHLNISDNIFQASFGSFNPPASLRVLALNGSSPELDEDCWTSHNEEFVDEAVTGTSHHFEDILTLDFDSPDRTFKPFVAEGINLQNFSNLEALSLRNNNFKNIPQLNYLKKLKYLDLDGNNIKTVTSNVLLSELNVLDLSNNKMERFPTLHQFPKLKKLDLIGNKIKSLEQFGATQNLILISLNKNLLTNLNILAKPIYKKLRLELEENPVVDKKSHCPFKTPNSDLNWYCNRIVNKPDDAERFD
jgi:Leucine-rich repeat (LRR) protein